MKNAFFALVCLALALFSLNAAALEAPTIRSPSHPNQGNWYNQSLISFEWTRVEEATGYYYAADQNPDTTPTTADTFTEYRYGSAKPGRDGTYYIHVSAAEGANIGPAAHYKVQLDLTKPDWSELSPLKATPTREGYIKLSWGEATDATSGIDYYELYRGAKFDFDLRSANRKYSPIIETSYTDTNNMEQNITFFYLLVVVDNAGNQSRVSNKASATTYAFCDVNVSLDVSLSNDKKKLLISIASDANLYSSTLTAMLPNGRQAEFFSNTSIINYNTEFDLNETPEGVIKVDLSARERLGDDCSQSTEFIYDITNPSIEIVFPKLNETISGEVKVKATAFDNGDYKSGISSVEFFVRTEQWQSLGTMAADGNGVYSIDWNTFNFSNGRYQLKAIAKDVVGNSAEHSSGAVILNTLYQQGDANAAINAALDSKQEALRFIDSLKKQNVVSETINALLEAADSNISKAKELYDVGGNEYTNARAYAKIAQEIFDSIEGQLTLEKIDAGAFIYNKEQVAILLNASPLDRALIEEAKLLIEKASPQRKLELLKVRDANNVYFRANIVVSFAVPADYIAEKDLNSLSVIEFIPKEFAANASGIYSAYDFTVMEDDPIIGFEIDKETISLGQISYGLNTSLTEEDANALIENNIINKYVVPPILLHSQATIAPPGFSIPTFAIPQEIIIGIIIVIVVAIAIVIALFVFKKRKKGKKQDLSIFE